MRLEYQFHLRYLNCNSFVWTLFVICVVMSSVAKVSSAYETLLWTSWISFYKFIYFYVEADQEISFISVTTAVHLLLIYTETVPNATMTFVYCVVKSFVRGSSQVEIRHVQQSVNQTSDQEAFPNDWVINQLSKSNSHFGKYTKNVGLFLVLPKREADVAIHGYVWNVLEWLIYLVFLRTWRKQWEKSFLSPFQWAFVACVLETVIVIVSRKICVFLRTGKIPWTTICSAHQVQTWIRIL